MEKSKNRNIQYADEIPSSKVEIKPETKCEVCGAGLGRTEVYGRNLCEHCEDQLHG